MPEKKNETPTQARKPLPRRRRSAPKNGEAPRVLSDIDLAWRELNPPPQQSDSAASAPMQTGTTPVRTDSTSSHAARTEATPSAAAPNRTAPAPAPAAVPATRTEASPTHTAPARQQTPQAAPKQAAPSSTTGTATAPPTTQTRRPNTQTMHRKNTNLPTAQGQAQAVSPAGTPSQGGSQPLAAQPRQNRPQQAAHTRTAPQVPTTPRAPQQNLNQPQLLGMVAPDQKKAPAHRRAKKSDVTPVKIIPLGGLGEIGKNMTLIEYQNDIIIIDCGLAFPDDDMPGIDLVIPDFTYAIKNRDRIRGVLLTHGHEDHIGALAYLLKEIDVPVYSARLTIGLVEGKLKEMGVLGRAKLNVIKAGETIKLGQLSAEFIAVNHSIPDACAIAVFTPAGVLVHTGDFKIDYTPIDGVMINLARFGELGSRGVLALMCDSTNAERPGMTPSERNVGESFEMLFQRAGGKRILVASFSSNVHRIQQVIDCAVRHGRRVVISGRSMENVTAKAAELGYLKIPPNTLLEIDKMRNVPDEQVVIITTGSQGEPMSALTRMARGEHRKIAVTGHDFIIISASPIPGNEKLVGKVINDLMQLGADVIYESTMGIHVSGHACREEMKAIIGLTRPRFFVPVHGEYKHLAKNRELAMEMGIAADHIALGDIGRVIELTPDSVKMVNTVPSGAVMVDGSGIGDVGSTVLRDRKLLAEDGVIIAVATIDGKTGAVLSGPDVVSRGFVYVRESEELLAAARQICKNALASATDGSGNREWANLKQAIRDQLGSFLYSKTKRRPMVIPIIQEV